MDFRGLDSSVILILRAGIPRPIGDFPEILSQAMLVGMMSVGRSGGLQKAHRIENACWRLWNLEQMASKSPKCEQPGIRTDAATTTTSTIIIINYYYYYYNYNYNYYNYNYNYNNNNNNYY